MNTTTRIGALMLALALAPVASPAQQPGPRQADPQAEAQRADQEKIREELAATREQLADMARRMAELSRQLAPEAERLREHTAIALRELRHSRPIIGILMGPDEHGKVVVSGVTPEGPAAKAGMKAGDVLERINGKAIEGKTDAQRLDHARALIGDLAEGQEVRIDYRRDGKAAKVALKAEKMDRLMVWAPGAREPLRRLHERIASDADWPHELSMEIERITPFALCGEDEDCEFPTIGHAFRWSGLSLASVDADLGRYFGVERGALVLSPIEDLEGLRSGDVILEIDGVAVDGPRQTMRELRRKEPGSQVSLKVQREQRAQTVTLTAPEARALRFIAPPPPPEPPKPPEPSKAPKAPPPPAPPEGAV